MNLKKGDRVLCVENNSTVRPLVIESIDGGKVLFSKQLDKGIKKTFGLKKGSLQLIKPRYISEHEKEEYKNPDLEMNDRVKVIHVEGTDNTNLLGRDGIVISIKENERGDREIMLYMEDTQQMANLELEYRMWPNQTGQDSLSGELIQKSLVLKLDEPKAKQEDYIDGLLHIPEQTEEKKQKISPDLEVGDRIMAWDITGENQHQYTDIDGTLVSADIDKLTPSTFISTVIEILEYDQTHQNGIKYLVKIEDTDEVVGLYGGEWLGGSIHPIRDMYQKGTRDKWLKLPNIGITEDTDIFGQGLLDPIEPEEFEGEEEEWDELVGDVEDDEFVVEPEYTYKGGKTNPETGFVAPSAEVTDNICKVKGFCDAQGPITFGQLKALVEEATKKRISSDIGRGVFKSLWRIIPFFVPQVLLASVGVTVTRAFNKIITPALKDTGGYKSWWGKVVLKAMDIAEGDYIPDIAMGDDPLSKIFFISDGLLQMIRDKYKLKFARYVAEYASTRPDNEPVPEWFVENLLRDYLNQKFLLDPPLEPKEDTDFQMIREHEEEMDPEDGIQTREPFTKTEAQILNYLAREFTWEELNTISSIDETQVIGELERKWDNTLKLFGQAPKGNDEAWIRSTRWAKWAVENWEEAKVEMDGGGYSQDFKKVTTPRKSWPSWFEVNADESYWQKEYRQGTIEIGAYDREDAEERAEISWWDYDPDMDHYDYGDTDDHELEMKDVTHMKALNEHSNTKDGYDDIDVQTIVDRVYPHIVKNLGPSKYVNQPPTVELWNDIYARLSSIPEMRGEDSRTSKSEHDDYGNMIYIYHPNMKDVGDVIKALLHEYTHSLQDPTKKEENRKLGYDNDPDEIESREAELNWEEYLQYVGDNLQEPEQRKISPELEVDDIIMVIEVEGDDYEWKGQTKRPETFAVYRVLGKGGFAKFDGARRHYDLIKLPVSKETRHRIYTIYEQDTWIYAEPPQAISEHKESKINPDLDEGDTIRVIEVDGEHANMPEVWGIYKVHDVRQDNATQELYYELSGETSEIVPDTTFSSTRLTNSKYLYPGDTWIPADVPMANKVDRKTISEHKDSKLNPQLMVGDEIMVVSTEGVHDFGAPELYKPYVVVGIKHGTTMNREIHNWTHGEEDEEDRRDSPEVPRSRLGFRKEFDTIPYTYYQIEPLDMTDEDRLGSMLAGGGRIKPMYIFPSPNEYRGSDQWILRPGFLRGEHLTEEIESGSGFDYIFGDSIAVGLSMRAGEKHPGKTGVVMRTKLGWSREGAAPQEILRNIKEFIVDNDLTNKKVLLSSGYSNGQDLNSIRNEIDVLNGAGANVYLLGVSHTFPKEGEHNVILEEIANEKGITFLGGFDAPSDNVHPSYNSLYGSLNEHAGDRNMKGFTPKLIGYLKFLFETKEIRDSHEFIKETTSLFNIGEWEAQVLYLMVMYNSNHTGRKEMLEMLNNMPIEDYEIPQVWEYEVQYYGDYEHSEEEEECDDNGFGQESGDDCECEHGVTYVQDKDGDEVEEDCDFEKDDDCECMEWWRKEYDVFYNMMCNKIIYSTTKLEKTHEGSDEAYGYHQMYEIKNELNDSNSIVQDESCDPDYDDGQTWEYFQERDDEIIGLDTDKLAEHLIPNLLEKINNKIYGIKPLIDIIEEQYDVMSDKDTKMKDLTSQIFDILDDNFDIVEHPEGEIEYDGKNMGLYSYDNDSFVPFEHIYNPIIQMLEGGIQQEDIEVFVEIITNWVNYVMSEKKEYLNEEVNIKSDDSNYSKEEYENFVDFAHKELNIEKECSIDVEAEKSSEYTTGNYHIHDRKIKILDNGRKLADILRTIAHELVHHKQNELGQLVGDIPEIGGKIEDQANAYAGRLVKKYGKQTPNLYTESEIGVLSEEKVVGFLNPNNNFVVVAGGPGAGKSFITKNLVNLDNVKEFNVDQVRVMTAKKLWGDEWEEKISTEEGYDEILRRTFTTSDPRNLTVKFLKQFLQAERDQPVNVIYDAGGGQEQVMKDIHQLAKENGFTTTLVHVRTPLDVAQERNIDRPRSLPPEMVAQYHQQVKDNMRNMIPIFDNVWSVDNKELIDLSDRPSDNIEKIKEQTDEAIRIASLKLPIGVDVDESSEIFYLRSDKKWEYTLIDDIWNTRKRDSDDSWISLKDDKFRKTRRKLDKMLLNKGDWEPDDTEKTFNQEEKCNFIIPIAWPTYEPKLEKGAGDFEVWGARVYAAIMSNDFTSKAGTYGKLGHGGVATVEHNGRVRLFEFGRYAGSSQGMGITLRSDLGKIAKFGEGNNYYCRISNIKEVVNAIKRNSYGEGKTLPMVGHVVKIPNVEGAIGFANQSTQRKYKAIDLTIGDDAFNCGTFIYDVAEAGGLEMGSWCFPDPESVVDSFEDLSIQKIRA